MANELVPDFTNNFSGGQNASLDPGVLPENMYASAVNVSTARATLRPRWGWDRVELDFSNTGNYTTSTGKVVSFENIFHQCNFQGRIPYSIGPDYYLIIIVSGFLFLINQTSLEVKVLNPNDSLNQLATRINSSPAGEYLVVFDFPNLPAIVQGITFRRSDLSKDEVPISLLGTYNQNRLFIANAGNEFTGGDPAGSLAAPNAPITFIEVNQSSSPYVGQVFQLSTNYNNDSITALGFLQVNDTSTGIGPLLVSTPEAIYSYHTEVPRNQWEAGQFGSVLLYNAGIVAQRAFTNLNGDLIFMANDGQLRSLSMSRNEQGQWANTPISREVENWIKFNDESLKIYSFVTYYKNKIFVGCNPYKIDSQTAEGKLVYDVVCAGASVMELDNLSGLGSPAQPVWAGLWTGIRPLDMVVNNEVCFAVGKDGNSNELYILNPKRYYDTVRGKKRLQKAIIYTREYSQQDPTVNKAIHSLDLGFKEIAGNLKVSVSYKPAHLGYFTHWRDFEYCAPTSQCGAIIQYPNGLAAQSIRDLNIGGVDENVCDPSGQQFTNIYKEVQLRIEISAEYWELSYIKLKGRAIPNDQLNIFCPDTDRCVMSPAKCLNDWRIEYGNKECD